jgi:DNA-binding IclR family transcriptional regulator
VSRGHDRRRRYRPTMRVVALAGQVVERAELTGIAAPHVRALRDYVGMRVSPASSSRSKALASLLAEGTYSNRAVFRFPGG